MKKNHILAATLGYLLTVTAALSQNWVSFNGEGSLAGFQGGSYCDTHPRAGAFCVIAGCRQNEPIGLYVTAAALAQNGLRDATLNVDDERLGPLFFKTVDGYSDLFLAPLPAQNAAGILQALRAGSAFVLNFQEGSDALAFQGQLSGSARAIGYGMGLCPLPQGTATAAAQAPRPVARPDDVPLIDRIFLDNGCVATEDQLFSAIAAEYSISDAQAQILNWSQSPGFSQDYDVLSRDPFTYRWRSPLCTAGTTPQDSPEAIGDAFNAALQTEVQKIIIAACQGRGGQLPPAGIRIADLDSDGAADLIVDEAWISCDPSSTGTSHSASCSTHVCQAHFLMWRTDALQLVQTHPNRIGNLLAGDPIGIPVVNPDGSSGLLRWDGAGFSAN